MRMGTNPNVGEKANAVNITMDPGKTGTTGDRTQNGSPNPTIISA